MKHSKFASRLCSLFVVAASVCAVGCGPRGESHTVEQILDDARVSYQSASTKVPSADAATMKSLQTSLDKLAGLGGGGDAKVVAGDIANSLNGLITRAGYTARPAMAELISQYRTVAADTASTVSIGAPNLKLLAARTYSLLSAELTTTQFRL
jgi:hypothetical protein